MPIYMRITKNGLPVVSGDATAKGHEKWIELSNAQMSQSGSATHGEQSGSTVSEIVITKSMDSASTGLFSQSLYSEGVTIQIDFVKSGGNGSTYLTFTLENALMSGYQLGGSGWSGGPAESLTLNFTKMTFNTRGTSPDVSGHAHALVRDSPGTRCAR